MNCPAGVMQRWYEVEPAQVLADMCFRGPAFRALACSGEQLRKSYPPPSVIRVVSTGELIP